MSLSFNQQLFLEYFYIRPLDTDENEAVQRAIDNDLNTVALHDDAVDETPVHSSDDFQMRIKQFAEVKFTDQIVP